MSGAPFSQEHKKEGGGPKNFCGTPFKRVVFHKRSRERYLSPTRLKERATVPREKKRVFPLKAPKNPRGPFNQAERKNLKKPPFLGLIYPTQNVNPKAFRPFQNILSPYWNKS